MQTRQFCFICEWLGNSLSQSPLTSVHTLRQQLHLRFFFTIPRLQITRNVHCSRAMPQRPTESRGLNLSVLPLRPKHSDCRNICCYLCRNYFVAHISTLPYQNLVLYTFPNWRLLQVIRHVCKRSLRITDGVSAVEWIGYIGRIISEGVLLLDSWSIPSANTSSATCACPLCCKHLHGTWEDHPSYWWWEICAR